VKDKSAQPAVNFLKTAILPGTTVDAAPLIEQAGAKGIGINQLTRARVTMNITSFKAGNTWKWTRPSEGSTNGEGSQATA
jgi:hypothetical protein